MRPAYKLLLGGSVLILAVSAVASTVEDAGRRVDPAESDSAIAERREIILVRADCKTAIQQKLKAPKTAEWDNVQASVSTQSAAMIVVVGKVTAQNSFGARLTKSFGCEYNRTTRQFVQVLLE